MRIQIDGRSARFENKQLVYNLYYFDAPEFSAATNAGIFKQVILQWVNTLDKYSGTERSFFLPFAPDDEWIDCVKATEIDGKLLLSCVRVYENGWLVDSPDLESFITASHEANEEFMESLEEIDKAEFIAALKNAELTDI